jgi:hypothetical protein
MRGAKSCDRRGCRLSVSQFGLLAAPAWRPAASLAVIGQAMLLNASTPARNFAVMERRKLIVAERGRGRGGKSLNLTKADEKRVPRRTRSGATPTVSWRRTRARTKRRQDACACALGEAAEHIKRKERPEGAAAPKSAGRHSRTRA